MAARLAAATRGPKPMPAAVAPAAPYPHKTTLPLSEEDWRALKEATLDDGAETAARVRAMIALWREDPKVRERVDTRAAELKRWAARRL